MTCRMCLERGKTWEGGDPICSFPDGGEFQSDGWNCATANAIRDIAGDAWEAERDPRTDYRVLIGGDQQYATIEVSDIDLPIQPPWRNGEAYALWVTWYKHRGRTEGMWLLSADRARLPTEADALAIIGAARKKD